MILEPAEKPLAEASLADYFRRRLNGFAQQLDAPPREDTCWYIGTLLERFSRSDRLFAHTGEGMDLRPLALLYGDALEAPDERSRCLMLQQLGDMALFLGALFPDRFTHRGIQQDYVVGMGGRAYDYLAGNARTGRHIFEELAGMFAELLALIARACSRQQEGNEDVIALYERWARSGDPELAMRLRRLGVIVSEVTPCH
jgi:hypothetical protein